MPLYAEVFEKKFIKIKYCRARYTLKILGVAISSDRISFRFLLISGHCGQLRKTKTGRFKAEELVVTGKFFFDYLRRKNF